MMEDKIKNEEKIIEELTQANKIAEHVAKMIISAGNYPVFGKGNITVAKAAEILGKDQTWVKAGIISGWLPIGYATKNGELVTNLSQITPKEKATYYISPKLLWEITGYVWEG